MGCLKLQEEKSRVLKVVYKKDTTHEHFFDQDIIHMNGRIYDPKLQTFLSPDINILDPTDSQHYNRYSYALNNPLLYTDPSGNVVVETVMVTAAIVGAIIGGISYIALTAYYGNAFTFDAFAKNVIIGAVSSAAFQFGLGLLKDVLFPALANGGGAYMSTGGGDALIKMPNFLCEPCAEQAKNLKTLIWSGRIASGIGGGAGTALTQSKPNLFNASSSFNNPPGNGNSNINYPKKTSSLDGLSTGMGYTQLFTGSLIENPNRFVQNGINKGKMFNAKLKTFQLHRKNGALNGNKYISGKKFVGRAGKLKGVVKTLPILNAASVGLSFYQAYETGHPGYVSRGLISTMAGYIPWVGPGLSFGIESTDVNYWNMHTSPWFNNPKK